MNWVIRQGNTASGVGYTVGLLVGRLEYLAAGKANSPKRLIEESLEFARALQGWVKENEPPIDVSRFVQRPSWQIDTEAVHYGAGGKPGPMSDG